MGVERTVDVLVGAQLASSVDGGIGIGRELSLGVQSWRRRPMVCVRAYGSTLPVCSVGSRVSTTQDS